MSNIILVTHWTGGDVYPFIRFGKMLKEEGHKVTILTHCVYENVAKEAGLEFIAVDTKEEYEQQNRDLALLADPIGKKEEYIRFHTLYHGKERLLREVALIETICTPDSIIIARHRSSISGLIAAEKNHLPYASMILAPNYFSHMELHDQLFGKKFCEEINQARTELGLTPISNWKDWLYSPGKILCGWPKWYAQADETWPECAVPIGFLAAEQPKEMVQFDPEVSAFLEEAKNKKKKTVIVTGGSSRMVSKEFYQTAIQACSMADIYAIAVTPYDEYIPETVPDTILCVRHVPLRALMNKVDLIIHHGGMGTINEAVDAALPQLLMPHLTDGPDNADRLSALGIAEKYSPKMWDPENIAEGITRLLDGRMKEKCLQYRDLNQEEYSARVWKTVIPEIEPYVLPRQEKKYETAVNQAGVNRQVSREMLMKILRKKQENKEG